MKDRHVYFFYLSIIPKLLAWKKDKKTEPNIEERKREFLLRTNIFKHSFWQICNGHEIA